MIYFTSSWDDGASGDIRLSELLLKYELKGTFFIPLFNIENRAVITQREIATLSNEFEIGAHTVNHKYLTGIPDKEAEYEIKQSKKELEAIINKPVPGFCFPGGKYRANHLNYVKEAGFKYARTVNMFKYQNNGTVMNTSLQAFDHSKYTYFKHLLKRGYFNEIFQYAGSIFSNNTWDGLLGNIMDQHIKNDSEQKDTVIHLWGHSWEIEENNSWQQLERFFAHIKNKHIQSKTNFEIAQLTGK